MDDKLIQQAINEYYGQIDKDEHARYKSWEHCYSVFLQNKDNNDDDTIDYLSLHLAFYLASWGMLRGSSFLLQKDYKIHIGAIKIMKRDEYKNLYGIPIDKLLEKENFELLIKLIRELKFYYEEIRLSVKQSKTKISQTLISKILLGVYGCVPAFDRYFCDAITKYDICSKSIIKYETYKGLLKFYNEHIEVIEKNRKEITKRGVEYSQMKMLDIIFWQIGFDKE